MGGALTLALLFTTTHAHDGALPMTRADLSCTILYNSSRFSFHSVRRSTGSRFVRFALDRATGEEVVLKWSQEV